MSQQLLLLSCQACNSCKIGEGLHLFLHPHKTVPGQLLSSLSDQAMAFVQDNVYRGHHELKYHHNIQGPPVSKNFNRR